MMFLITLIFFGLIAIPCFILALVMGETWKSKLSACLVILFFWLAISGACWATDKGNNDKWNGGYCKCGTHWELRGASHYRTSHTKYYACPNCHAEIEIGG